ncbi:MAG: 1,4-alpha-glucan branching protein GlgB [Lachnospira sp.]
MDNKLYKLMNWPDIEGIVYGESENPSELLGGHLCKEGFLIQAFRPDAVSLSVNVAGKAKSVAMEKVDEAGFFAVLIPSKKAVSYTFTMEDIRGKTSTFEDPYSFGTVTDERKLKAFAAGNEKNAAEIFGGRVTTVNKVKGVLFTVWAPNALGVSVKGEFNKWNGSTHQMNKIGNTGVFEIFIPGLSDGTEYLYEIRVKGQKSISKLDPYSRKITSGVAHYSVVEAKDDYQWKDGLWLQSRAQSDKKEPMSIYEIDVVAWAKLHRLNENIADVSASIIEYVKSKGFTHIELMPVFESFNPYTNGYTCAGYYAVGARYGTREELKAFVDACHGENIGVIFDWNCAYFGDDALGLNNFDGADCYGYLRPRLEKNPDWNVVTFAYEKGEVRSFLMSGLTMLLDEFHADGVRIDGVASMLYLDYGKAPSTWQPNMYGGNENLAAIDFIKSMNSYVKSRKDGVLTFAEESSGWAGVTDSNEGDNLGFSFKWNDGWRKDFLKFFGRDPLFRKGDYDSLTYGMLYNYGEDYCLALEHDNFKRENGAMVDMAAGAELSFKLADMRAAYGYLYTHPGAKLIAMGQDIGLDITWPVPDTAEFGEYSSADNIGMGKFITDLNALYKKENALHELDYDPAGFEWLENSNPNETVIAYARKDSKGKVLTVVINFTPVYRENYTVPVLTAGKYKEILNSNLKKYGGDGKVNSGYYLSETEKNEAGRVKLSINLPASGIVILQCTEYTDKELKEIAIRKKIEEEKRLADEKVKSAEQLVLKAKEELEAALENERQAKEAERKAKEAERQAKEAARAALAASEAAQKNAEEAKEEYRYIDEKLALELARINGKKV